LYTHNQINFIHCASCSSWLADVSTNANPLAATLADKVTDPPLKINGWVACSQNGNSWNGKNQTYCERSERDSQFLQAFFLLQDCRELSGQRNNLQLG
jgi:hypothetical protein